MGRIVDVDDLVNLTQIAQRLGISRSLVAVLAKNPHAPRPVRKERYSRLWLMDDWRVWDSVRTRRTMKTKEEEVVPATGGSRLHT